MAYHHLGVLMEKLGSFSTGSELFHVYKSHYQANGATAITLMCDNGEPYGHLSVNVDGVSDALPKGSFVVSHNVNDWENSAEMQKQLLHGFFEDIGETVSYGYVTGQPVWRIP